MTDAELHAAIFADPTLKAHAVRGEDGHIVRALTKPSTVTPITIGGLLGALSQESAAKLAVNPNVTDVRDKVLSGDLAGLLLWVNLFEAGGIITSAEAAAIKAAVAAATPNAVTVQLEQVNRVLRPHRNEGKAGAKNWVATTPETVATVEDYPHREEV